MTNFEKVKQFHREVVRKDMPTIPTIRDDGVATLRWDLIAEELGELDDALGGPDFNDVDLVEVADALGDLLYVVYGMADCYGINIDEVFDEIHKANMTKKGSPVRKDGKILKGLNYKAPNVKAIIERQMKNGATG